jgi:hypothetical protein
MGIDKCGMIISDGSTSMLWQLIYVQELDGRTRFIMQLDRARAFLISRLDGRTNFKMYAVLPQGATKCEIGHDNAHQKIGIVVSRCTCTAIKCTSSRVETLLNYMSGWIENYAVYIH